jgi:radical SAM-linked protein
MKKRRNIIVKYHDPEMSELEGILARGDRKLFRAIETAFRKGARFDGWSDSFKPCVWQEAFDENGIDPSLYLKGKDSSFSLPWKVIETGTSKSYMLKEREKGLRGEKTSDCAPDCINYCGNCDFRRIKPRPAKKTAGIKIDKKFLSEITVESEPRFICRFLYCKTGQMKYIGPIDLEELFERAMIRANLPVVFTKGYNPHIRVEMGWALPVGFSSLYEVAEIDLAREFPVRKLIKGINSGLPKGLNIISIKLIKMPYPRLTRLCREHYAVFSFDSGPFKKEIISRTELMGMFIKTGSKDDKAIDLKEYLDDFSFDSERVRIIFLQKEGGARMRDYISYLTGYDSRQSASLDPMVHYRYIKREGIAVKLFDVTEDDPSDGLSARRNRFRTRY